MLEVIGPDSAAGPIGEVRESRAARAQGVATDTNGARTRSEDQLLEADGDLNFHFSLIRERLSPLLK